MSNLPRRAFMAKSAVLFAALVAGAAAGIAAAQTPALGVKWVCPPCGCSSDGKEYDAPGSCPECGMTLIQKPVAASPTPAKPAADSSAGKPAAAPKSANAPTSPTPTSPAPNPAPNPAQ